MLINYLKRSNYISETTSMGLKRLVLPLGMFTFSSSLLLTHFGGESAAVDFSSGFLMGLSIVLNVAGIIIARTLKKK